MWEPMYFILASLPTDSSKVTFIQLKDFWVALLLDIIAWISDKLSCEIFHFFGSYMNQLGLNPPYSGSRVIGLTTRNFVCKKRYFSLSKISVYAPRVNWVDHHVHALRLHCQSRDFFIEIVALLWQNDQPCWISFVVTARCTLTLKGQCKPHGLGIILVESCSKLLLHCTKWGF